jgi:hypothetical protein
MTRNFHAVKYRVKKIIALVYKFNICRLSICRVCFLLATMLGDKRLLSLVRIYIRSIHKIKIYIFHV